MMTIRWLIGGFVGLGLICAACGGTSTTTTTSTMTKPTPKSEDATVCAPGKRRCDGHDIKRCDATGAVEVVESSCLSQECRMQAGEPVCPPTVCAASQPMCDGNIATQCKLDGSGREPGGVDCGSKQSCVAGNCRDLQCVAGSRSCQEGNVYLCAADGLSLSEADHCATNQVCNDSLAACVTQMCKPNASMCSGSRVATCNSLGSNWLPAAVDCADQGQTCIAGSCSKRVCNPSTTYCSDGNLYQCDPTGASTALSKVCRPGFEHCELTPAGLYAFCVADSCTAGNKLCVGDTIKTCNADGSLPTDGITCAKDEYCEDAECKPRLCRLGTHYCHGEDIYSCEPNGPQLYTDCDTGEACRNLLPNLGEGIDPGFAEGLVWCSAPSCPPGHADCVLNKIGACAADGTTLSAVSSDCAADGKICTADLACATSTTDTLGQSDTIGQFSQDTYWGNVIDVRSPRKLTELQLWLAFASTRTLHWMVFEQVDNQFILRADKTTAEATGAGFVSSGALSFNYQLEAGKRYSMGLAVSGGDSVVVYQDAPFATKPSFGDPLGVASAFNDFSSFDVAGGFYRWTLAYMKITTAAP